MNPDLTFEAVCAALPEADLLLVMSVFPRFGGQSFIESTLKTVEAAARFRELLVAGTAIFKQPDYAAAIRAIRGTP